MNIPDFDLHEMITSKLNSTPGITLPGRLSELKIICLGQHPSISSLPDHPINYHYLWVLSILFIGICITILNYKFLCVKAKQDDKSLGESWDARFVLKLKPIPQEQESANEA